MSVATRCDGAILHVVLDAPPVNAIGRAMRQGLLDAVHEAGAAGVERVIVSGAGRAFAAGADAREFDAPPAPPHLPDVLDAIERSPVPWIAAIDGVALGGGAEIAMACRMRIAAPGARIGLPEVTLGVIPGAGGTQRLPRLIGLSAACEMIAFGKPVDAARARELGLVDAVEPDPVAAARAVPSDVVAAARPVRDMPPPDDDPAARARIGARLAARHGGQIAGPRALEIVAGGLSRPFDVALAAERAAFLELRASSQARALRHVFFAERGAKAPPRLGVPMPTAPRCAAVVGGGTMGAGIAYAMLEAGLDVVLIETDATAAARAAANVDRLFDAGLERGRVDAAAVAARRARLTVAADYAAACEADLAIEAAFEDMDVKRAIFAALERALPAEAVLATNTSYLDLDRIAAAVADPGRVVGLHFFAPAHVMRLLEVVRGARTSDRALATGFALAKALRKVPVLSGVCDGFIGNRILTRYRAAAEDLLLRGATPATVDDAMRAFGYAMGPFEAQDLSGLDIAHAARRTRAAQGGDASDAPVADRLVAAGQLGRKAGAGWYRYPTTGDRDENPDAGRAALDEAARRGVPRGDPDADEIARRLVLAMVNEAAAILDEGIARTATDIDLVTVLGYGFPRWRGGLMHHAQAIGVEAVVGQLSALAEEDPAYAPAPLLVRCARTGCGFDEAHRGDGSAASADDVG